MIGDNDSAVNSSMTPQGKIHKRHVALSFYRIREAIAAKIISYQFINGKINPTDILSKHWDHHCAWPTLKPLLFWKGDTMECLDNNTLEFEEQSWKELDLFVLCSSSYIGNCMDGTCNYFYMFM